LLVTRHKKRKEKKNDHDYKHICFVSLHFQRTVFFVVNIKRKICYFRFGEKDIFIMNLFIIILSLVFFHGNYIYGLNSEGLTGINVLEALLKLPNCYLSDFVKSEDDSKLLADDLKTYCTTSDTSKQYVLICRMVFYELKKACKLSVNSRPSKAIYQIQESSKEICGKKSIPLTNEWIWNKITHNGEKNIGVKAEDLCTKVTSDTNTIRLARFFYKIAPRVRHNDQKEKQGLLK